MTHYVRVFFIPGNLQRVQKTENSQKIEDRLKIGFEFFILAVNKFKRAISVKF